MTTPRRLDVDRMRRHQRRTSGRPRLTTDERIRHLRRSLDGAGVPVNDLIARHYRAGGFIR